MMSRSRSQGTEVTTVTGAFSTDWYQLGSVQFGSALFGTYSFPLQLVAIATKHSEKQHEQSALS